MTMIADKEKYSKRVKAVVNKLWELLVMKEKLEIIVILNDMAKLDSINHLTG